MPPEHNCKHLRLFINWTNELEERKNRELPKEIIEYLDVCVFNDDKFKKLEPKVDPEVVIGDVILDEDERSILTLNPKFAVLRKLELETAEREIEVGLAKLRLEVKQIEEQMRQEEIEFEASEGKKLKIERKSYEEQIICDAKERQTYDPFMKVLDLAKKRVTDLKENSKVTLPQATDEKIENEMEMIREVILEEHSKYIKEIEEKIRKEARIKEKIRKDNKNNINEKIDCSRNQEWRNLTRKEKRGLVKIKKRVKDGELVVVKTDKSGKLMVLSKDEYLRTGIIGIGDDEKVNREDVKRIEKQINSHSRFWIKITKLGEAHNHYKRRIESILMESETVAPRYYMYKDHKEGGGCSIGMCFKYSWPQ